MEHGYTNETVRQNDIVLKRHCGEGAVERARLEADALGWAYGRLPVPRLVAWRTDVLVMKYVAGVHGQDALSVDPRGVLRACGELARQLQALQPPDFLGTRSKGQVVVHGDFGPQNLLLEHGPLRPVALLDWERVHLGQPVEDLSWAEWMVRYHHPSAATALGEMYDAYGRLPAWRERKESMLATCAYHRTLAASFSQEAVTRWEERLQWTRALSGG